MAYKENQECPRCRASFKRPAESEKGDRMLKKRTVLGELTNNAFDVSNFSQSSIVGKSRKLETEQSWISAESENSLDLVEETPIFQYPPSIYLHLRSLEVEATLRPSSNYMETVQTDINPFMRSVLIDWLVEVAQEYKLVSDTLYLTVNYIDRYLSTHSLMRTKLQLLGITCMLIASKHEEITPPHIENFVYITDNSFTIEEVMEMEKDVLKFINFEIGLPTTKTFLRIMSEAVQEEPEFSDPEFDRLCSYLGELSLTDYSCICNTPSIVAASAIFLAKLIIQPTCHPWNLALQQLTGYKPNELKECVLRLHNRKLTSEKYAPAIRQKYMDPQFECVASLDLPAEIPARFFGISNE
ncbi:putative cyclin-A3-1 [Andrographis paniculata]|uniref:putative cyclin-A3-1 n=1 Tax=Andrographis paniculata TaxID=175694 RepID=UPI0021E80D00|nr:putative cyclin-A3-1 [Andrographis paniculata]